MKGCHRARYGSTQYAFNKIVYGDFFIVNFEFYAHLFSAIACIVVGEGKKDCPKNEAKIFLMCLKFRDLCLLGEDYAVIFHVVISVQCFPHIQSIFGEGN
jgi:hypothetical protein